MGLGRGPLSPESLPPAPPLPQGVQSSGRASAQGRSVNGLTGIAPDPPCVQPRTECAPQSCSRSLAPPVSCPHFHHLVFRGEAGLSGMAGCGTTVLQIPGLVLGCRCASGRGAAPAASASLCLPWKLFDLVYREETLLNVIKSVTRNGRSIILTAVLALILVYLFSIVGYLFFKDDFILEVDRLPNETALPGGPGLSCRGARGGQLPDGAEGGADEGAAGGGPRGAGLAAGPVLVVVE